MSDTKESLSNGAKMPDAWAVQDEIEYSLRDLLGERVPFEVDVREYDLSYRATVTLTTSPTPELTMVARDLEAKLAARNCAVEIELQKGDVPIRPRADYEQAKAEFDKVWQRLAGSSARTTREEEPASTSEDRIGAGGERQ